MQSKNKKELREVVATVYKLKKNPLELREKVVDGSLVENKMILVRSEGKLQMDCVDLTIQNCFSLFGLLSFSIRLQLSFLEFLYKSSFYNRIKGSFYKHGYRVRKKRVFDILSYDFLINFKFSKTNKKNSL